jgi:hypothetical protein
MRYIILPLPVATNEGANHAYNLLLDIGEMQIGSYRYFFPTSAYFKLLRTVEYCIMSSNVECIF